MIVNVLPHGSVPDPLELLFPQQGDFSIKIKRDYEVLGSKSSPGWIPNRPGLRK